MAEVSKCPVPVPPPASRRSRDPGLPLTQTNLRIELHNIPTRRSKLLIEGGTCADGRSGRRGEDQALHHAQDAGKLLEDVGIQAGQHRARTGGRGTAGANCCGSEVLYPTHGD